MMRRTLAVIATLPLVLLLLGAGVWAIWMLGSLSIETIGVRETVAIVIGSIAIVAMFVWGSSELDK